MASYAALLSLMNTMDSIQNHPRLSNTLDNKQIECLGEKVGFLLDFVERDYSHGGTISKEEAEDLESQIASTDHAAEAVIESRVVDQILAGSTISGQKSSCFLLNLQKLIEDMDAINKKAMKSKAETGFGEQPPTHLKPATSSRPLPTGKNAMVGFDDELILLMEKLTVQLSNRQIIQIVGMGGIGKTTLARNVYEHLIIVQQFDVRLWATISQEYNAEEILLQLLSCQKQSAGKKSVHELGEQLHKSLSGRRYLIILDDMWSAGAWDEIKLFFPDNGNGSRVVITTRISNMAIDFSSSSFVKNFLDENKSWKLFCEKVFGEEGCPLELEEIGKKIVKNCRGLPLSIVVIAGYLGKSFRTKEYWENIANNINSILSSGDDEQCLNILFLSYNHLPVYLKPCFLYMGIFPEDEEIFVCELTKLWVAEGFLKPNKAQSLEEIAEGYLKNLIERNLILIRSWSRNGKIKTCGIHDVLRELCSKVAEKERFFCVLDTPRAMHRERCVVIHGSIPEEKHHREVFHALKSAQLVRSLKCEGGELLFDFRLLRILNGVRGILRDVYLRPLEAHFQQVNLRYLNCLYNLDSVFTDPLPYHSIYLPSSISLQWNLQTLKIFIMGDCEVIAPSEIWEMTQLRHLEITPIYLPDPLPSDRLDQQDDFVLQNLQTLLTVKNFRLSKEVCRRIPNVRELQMLYLDFPSGCDASAYYSPHNLGCFHKLESLHLYFTEETHWRDFVLSLTFPSSLRELSLRNCVLCWEDLTMIGSLPHLEVLILLGANPVLGPEWNPIEGEFLCLKSLEIYACDDLICWKADSSHFPALENLVLGGMTGLDEIPSGIGDIPTLECIKLYSCSVPATISAVRILVEQESLENDGLQLQVEFSDAEEEDSFMEMVKLEGFTSNNLRLNPCYRRQEDDSGFFDRYADALLAALQHDA